MRWSCADSGVREVTSGVRRFVSRVKREWALIVWIVYVWGVNLAFWII